MLFGHVLNFIGILFLLGLCLSVLFGHFVNMVMLVFTGLFWAHLGLIGMFGVNCDHFVLGLLDLSGLFLV